MTISREETVLCNAPDGLCTCTVIGDIQRSVKRGVHETWVRVTTPSGRTILAHKEDGQYIEKTMVHSA